MEAIVLSGVTKQFRKSAARTSHTTLKSELVRLVTGRRRAPLPDQTLEVLRGVDLTVPAGTTCGVIGRNGSGKSTLLKLIAGIYRPTLGSLKVNGRISALLELGAGFHPDFSGRENILVNGIILGLSRQEIRAKLPEIIDFAELGSFIDEPVRTYSSGMYMRLAFAVATHVDPDVLLIDEILAVGDEHFSRKSRAKMDEFKERKKTILLVTHDLGTVQNWCDTAVWIDEGRIREKGDPSTVVDRYRRAVAEADYAASKGVTAGAGSAPSVLRPETGPQVGPDLRWGTFEAEYSRVEILDSKGAPATVFGPEDRMVVSLDYVLKQPLKDVVFGFAIQRVDGLLVYSSNSRVDRAELPMPLPARGTLSLEFPRLGLLNGEYRLGVAIHSAAGLNYDYHKYFYSFSIRSTDGDHGLGRPPHRWGLQASSTRSGDASAA